MLVGGRWPRSFGLLLLVLLLSGLLQAAFEVAAAPFPEAGALIAAIAMTPITTIGNLLIYLDLRSRKEAYSTEQLRRELNALSQEMPRDPDAYRLCSHDWPEALTSAGNEGRRPSSVLA